MGQTEFNGYIFPAWADALGWLVGFSTLVPFFVFIGYKMIKGKVNKTFSFNSNKKK